PFLSRLGMIIGGSESCLTFVRLFELIHKEPSKFAPRLQRQRIVFVRGCQSFELLRCVCVITLLFKPTREAPQSPGRKNGGQLVRVVLAVGLSNRCRLM